MVINMPINFPILWLFNFSRSSYLAFLIHLMPVQTKSNDIVSRKRDEIRKIIENQFNEFTLFISLLRIISG